MAVYVDDMYTIPLGRYRNMSMSHMIADTTEELLQMADKIGVKRKWIQKEGTRLEHFDICLSKRILAIMAGTVEVEMRELAMAAMQRAGCNEKLKIPSQESPV